MHQNRHKAPLHPALRSCNAAAASIWAAGWCFRGVMVAMGATPPPLGDTAGKAWVPRVLEERCDARRGLGHANAGAASPGGAGPPVGAIVPPGGGGTSPWWWWHLTPMAVAPHRGQGGFSGGEVRYARIHGEVLTDRRGRLARLRKCKPFTRLH